MKVELNYNPEIPHTGKTSDIHGLLFFFLFFFFLCVCVCVYQSQSGIDVDCLFQSLGFLTWIGYFSH